MADETERRGGPRWREVYPRNVGRNRSECPDWDNHSRMTDIVDPSAFSHTNRKGKTYFLHRRIRKSGKAAYVFARILGEGPVDEVPAGYEVVENANGLVRIRKVQPRIITELEEAILRKKLLELSKKLYLTEVKGKSIVVMEPVRLEAVDSPYRGFFMDEDWVRGGSYSPVLRFNLDDERSRTFTVERMTYRGEGGWSYPMSSGSLSDLAAYFLPHLGQDSMFELL